MIKKIKINMYVILNKVVVSSAVILELATHGQQNKLCSIVKEKCFIRSLIRHNIK